MGLGEWRLCGGAGGVGVGGCGIGRGSLQPDDYHGTVVNV